MPGLLGKRKSRPSEEDAEEAVDAQEILRRHFEARFKPIAVAPCAAPSSKKQALDQDDVSDGSQDDDDDSDADADQSEAEWDGVSEEDEDEDEEDEEDEDGMRLA